MVRIDSNSIEAPLYLLNDYNKGSFTYAPKVNHETGEVICSKLYSGSLGLGIKNVTIDERKGLIYLETSAKVLGDQYGEGINLNTIERVLDEVNKTGVVSINKNEFIEIGNFLKIDVTDNIKIEAATDADIVDSLMAFKSNMRYQVTPYKKQNNYGVVFDNTAKSFKERIIFYSKMHDIKKDKRLLNAVPYNHLEKEFSKVWRVESNIVSFEKIRDNLGVIDNGIQNVLNSTAKVNYNLFKKIQKHELQLELFCWDDPTKTFGDVLKQWGRDAIIEYCRYDMHVIESILLKKCKGRTGQYYSERNLFEQLITTMLTEQSMDATNLETPLIKMIEDLLLAA